MKRVSQFFSQYSNDFKFISQGFSKFIGEIKNIKYHWNRFRFTKNEQLNFIIDFASFYETGSAKDACLAIVKSVEQAKDKPLKKLVALDILDSLNKGYEVSDGMNKWFDQDALQVYRAGEKTGRIQKVLTVYAEQFEQIRVFKMGIISRAKLGLIMAGIGTTGLLALAKADWLKFPRMKPVAEWPDISQAAYQISYMLNDNIELLSFSIVFWKIYTYFLNNNTSETRIALDNYFPLSIFKGLQALRFVKMFTVLKNANTGDYKAIRIIHENSCKYMQYYTEQMQDNLKVGYAELPEVLDVGLLPPRLMSRLGAISKASGNEAKLKSLMVVSEYASKEVDFSLKKSSFYLAGLGWLIGGTLTFLLLVGFILTTLSFTRM